MSLLVTDISLDRTVPIVAAFGRLDAPGAENLRAGLTARDFLPSQSIVLDLGGVVRAVRDGLEAVDAIAKELGRRGHRVILIAPIRCLEWDRFAHDGLGVPVVSRLDVAIDLASDGSSIRT